VSRGPALETKIGKTSRQFGCIINDDNTFVFLTSNMSRRQSRKTEAGPPESELLEAPKKRRKVLKVEETEVVTKSPAKATKRKIKAGVEFEEENTLDTKESPKIKINRVKAKVVQKDEKPKKAPAKRKSKAEDDDAEDDSDKKVTKKRKTKEEKEAETMPLAARTAIGALKKAIYIGAHVSGAGG
jgi:AP endonuclease-1